MLEARTVSVSIAHPWEEAYEAVRDNSMHFFCAPGHNLPDVETVIERHVNYVVVEKGPEVADLVTETDPTRD